MTRLEQEAKQMELRGSTVRASRPARILLAEDDEDFRSLLAQAFRAKGYQVTESVDGPDLVSKLGTYVLFGPPADFDLVVSDIRMPGATALEILEAMRECEGVPPVILITAFPSSDTHHTAMRLGVAAVIEKPFEIEELLERTENVLAGRGGGAR
jgi:DNA-binding response OmpR family regulator